MPTLPSAPPVAVPGGGGFDYVTVDAERRGLARQIDSDYQSRTLTLDGADVGAMGNMPAAWLYVDHRVPPGRAHSDLHAVDGSPLVSRRPAHSGTDRACLPDFETVPVAVA